MKLRPERYVIKEIKKRKDVVIRISRCDLMGQPYVEIRQCYRDRQGSYLPSQKGLTFVAEHLDEVIEGLVELRKYFDKGEPANKQ
ncbi:MAG: hypothetical protein HOC71_12300 [Candidatus Latescibacteria bacterium]|jgi:hypothetical protein|nr:hypothetical protein [Candidatus Latescibacterota bacterium]